MTFEEFMKKAFGLHGEDLNKHLEESNDVFSIYDMEDCFNASKPKWKPVDEKCKDGKHYLFRLKGASSLQAFVDGFFNGEFGRAGLSSSADKFEYTEIPE